MDEVVVQEDGREQAKLKGRKGGEAFDDLPGPAIFVVRVRSDEIEVELVGVDFGEEIASAGEAFQIEELIFFEG